MAKAILMYAELKCYIFSIFIVSVIAQTCSAEDVGDSVVLSQMDLTGLSLVVVAAEGIHRPDKKGAYDPFVMHLKNKLLISSYTLKPSKEAHEAFNNKEFACLSPASSKVIEVLTLTEDDLVWSESFSKATGMLIFNSEHPAMHNLALLEHTPVGVVDLGYIYGIRGVYLNKVPVESYLELSEKVKSGELAAGLFIFPDVAIMDQVMENIEPFIQNSFVLWQGIESIVCHKNYAAHLKGVNTEILKLKASGRLKNGILSPD